MVGKILNHKWFPYHIYALILGIISLYFIISNQGILIFYGDSFEQQYAFYLGAWEKFHQLDFSLWNWSLGLGSNYFSYSFYFATSPFLFLVLLFPKAWLPYLFLPLNIIKLALLLAFSYQWFRKLNPNKINAFIGSLMITFSGWVLFFFHYNHFLDAFWLYPLILFQIESDLFIKRNRIWLFSIGALGIINYYFLYMFIPFLGIYVIFRLFSVYQKANKQLFSELIKGIGWLLLGIGLSAIVLLPSLSIALLTPRLGTAIEWTHINLKDAFRFISTLFSFVMYRFDPSYFISTDIFGGIGWGGGVSLYASILSLILIPFGFMKSDKKYVNIILYSLLAILFSFLPFYKLLQGSLDVRWYFMITFFNVTFAIKGLDNIEKYPELRKYLKFVLGSWILIIVAFFSISYLKDWNGSHGKELAMLVTAVVALLILYGFLLNKTEKFKTAIVTLLVLEVLLSFYLPVAYDKPMTLSELEVTNISESTVVDYIKQNETDEFYRIFFDSGRYTSSNDPFAKNYAGLSFYLSVYNYEQEEYLNRMKGTWSMPFTFGRTYTYQLLSVKYYITHDRLHEAPFGFDYLESFGEYEIYQNRYFYSLGYSTTQTVSEDDFKSLSYLNQDRLLMDHVVTGKSTNTEYKYFNELTKLYEWVQPTNIELDLESLGDSAIIYAETFDIPIVTIRSYADNFFFYEHYINKSYTWQYNYTSTYIPRVSALNGLEVIPDNLYNSPTTINLYVENDFSAYDLWRKNLNTFTNTQVLNDVVNASIAIKSDEEWIFTSIPYDKGWHVYVNDEEIEFSKVDLGFIGFKLSKGSYDIQFIYKTPYLKIGMVITLVSLLFVSFIKFFTLRKKD